MSSSPVRPVLLLALVPAVLAWLLACGGQQDSSSSAPPESGPVATEEGNSAERGISTEPLALAGGAEVEDDRDLVLMNWNVEWMWDGIEPEDGEIDFRRKGDPQAAREHVRAVAEVIRRVDADIVNLVEVEGKEVMHLLLGDYLPDAGYELGFVQGKDEATGQDLALLSRYPIGGIDREPTEGRSGRERKRLSKNYFATIDVPRGGRPLRLGLVGLHLLARPDRESRRGPREAQADVVRKSARRLAGQGRSLVVWGDFNDFDGAVPDRRRSKPITRVLEWIRALDPDDPSDDLGNALARLDRQQRSTNTYGTAIDHVLLSPELYGRVESVEILHDVRVSDHYPVVVRLDLGAD